MNAFQLRVLAVVAMIIDHVGLFLLGNFIWFRLIGRLAFPIFAFLIANGYVHTKNVRRYALRLGVFAVISQWPYVWVHRSYDPNFWGLNIFFTLLTGLGALNAWKRWRYWGLLVAFGLAVVAQLTVMDYGFVGVVCIWLFGAFYAQRSVAYAGVAVSFSSTNMINRWTASPVVDLQLVGILALPFIHIYNGQVGYRGLKYWFYPVHLVILGVMARVMK